MKQLILKLPLLDIFTNKLTYNRFVYELKGHINENTILFLLLSKENDYQSIINNLKNLYNMDCEILMKRRFKNERLAVMKFQKSFE